MNLITSLFILTSLISAAAILIRDKKFFQRYEKSVPYIIFGCAVINIVLAVYSGIERKNFETRSISLITGGDSYCYILPTNFVQDKGNRITLWLENPTDLPCYDIHIRMLDLEKWHGLMDNGVEIGKASRESEKYFDFDALWDHKMMIIGTIDLPIEVNHQSYNIWIDTRNHGYVELLRFQFVKGEWKTAYQVRPNGSNEALIEIANNDYPRDKNGKILWDLYVDQMKGLKK